MNALYTHLCLYISGAYNKMNARLDAKREAGIETIEIVIWSVAVLAIVALVYPALSNFVGGLLSKLSVSF